MWVLKHFFSHNLENTGFRIHFLYLQAGQIKFLSVRSDDEQALRSCSWAGPIMLIPLSGQGPRRTHSDFGLFLLSFATISSLEKTTVAKRSLKVMGENKSKGTQKPLLLPYIRLLNVLLISEGSYHHFLLESGKGSH